MFELVLPAPANVGAMQILVCRDSALYAEWNTTKKNMIYPVRKLSEKEAPIDATAIRG